MEDNIKEEIARLRGEVYFASEDLAKAAIEYEEKRREVQSRLEQAVLDLSELHLRYRETKCQRS